LGTTYFRKYSGETPKDAILRHMGPRFAAVVEAHASAGSVHFFRIAAPNTLDHWDSDMARYFVPRADGKIATIIVVLTYHDRGAADGYDFGVKILGETSGPADTTCPGYLIRKCSAVSENAGQTGEWVTQWRTECLANESAALAKRPLLAVGNVLAFGTPPVYEGTPVHVVTVTEIPRGRTRRMTTVLHTPELGYLRPPKNLMDYAPRIVPPEPVAA
jgi:hypothetical protein